MAGYAMAGYAMEMDGGAAAGHHEMDVSSAHPSTQQMDSTQQMNVTMQQQVAAPTVEPRPAQSPAPRSRLAGAPASRGGG